MNVTSPDFKKVFESTPGLFLLLEPDFTITGATDAYLVATMTERKDILGRSVFEIFPDNPSDPHANGVCNLKASLQRVLNNRAVDVMGVLKYDIRRPAVGGGQFEERYWNPTNAPVFNNDREILYIIHRIDDVTELVRVQQTNSAQGEFKKRAQELEIMVSERTQQLRESVAELESFC